MEGDCVDKSSSDHQKKVDTNSKDQQLEQFRVNNDGKKLTTNQGLKVSNDEESLKAGIRGPTLMETPFSGKNNAFRPRAYSRASCACKRICCSRGIRIVCIHEGIHES